VKPEIMKFCIYLATQQESFQADGKLMSLLFHKVAMMSCILRSVIMWVFVCWKNDVSHKTISTDLAWVSHGPTN